jgi:hypothetical protein
VISPDEKSGHEAINMRDGGMAEGTTLLDVFGRKNTLNFLTECKPESGTEAISLRRSLAGDTSVRARSTVA